jgi:cobaltochelatase CobN
MGYSYGEDGWGVPNADLFRQNLAEVDGAVHSRSTNLYGVLDTDDCFQHLGGLALAVRSITGENPDLYITNLRDPHDPKTETLKSFLRRELNARYFNPKWIEGMMEHGYAGARYMDHKFLENLWGWDVVVGMSLHQT